MSQHFPEQCLICNEKVDVLGERGSGGFGFAFAIPASAMQKRPSAAYLIHEECARNAGHRDYDFETAESWLAEWG
jgi:hypothetical protein